MQMWIAGIPERKWPKSMSTELYQIEYEKQIVELHHVGNIIFMFMPYFFFSFLAHNLHLHQNLGLVALKTHWLHVCLYASCDNKRTHIHYRWANLEMWTQGHHLDFILARKYPNPLFHTKLLMEVGVCVKTTDWRLK